MKNLKNLIFWIGIGGSLIFQGCKGPEIFKSEKKDYIEFYSPGIAYRDLGKDGILDAVYDSRDDSPLKITKINYAEHEIIISNQEGNILFNIKDNLTKFNEQVKFMQKDFDDIKEKYNRQQTK